MVASLGAGRMKIEAAILTQFHTAPSFTPHHFYSWQSGLKTSVSNVKSVAGPQTAMTSHDAESESTHPADAFKFM